MTITILILAFLVAAALAHFGGILLLVLRPARKAKRPIGRPAVSILRPVCGIENYIEETLASTFALDYPRYEIVFCVADADDPAIPLIRRLMAGHPAIPSRLLVGEDRISVNPKLNNLVKGWAAARHDWIVMTDSNVLIPPDYLDRLLARWTAATGLVCSPPVGARPQGAGADLECAFLNTYQARWQLIADAGGVAFAQGKTMLWRREDLDDAGGITTLATEPAEDAAATKLLRAGGRKVRLVDAPFPQPLGRRDATAVWRRQLRWARLRRSSFPLVYAAEAAAGGFAPLAAVAALSAIHAFPAAGFMLFFAAWYGAEILLAWRFAWPVSVRIASFMVLRDLILPALWVAGWTGNRFTWRGNAMDIKGTAAKDPVRRLVEQWGRARVLRLLTALGASRRPVRTD